MPSDLSGIISPIVTPFTAEGHPAETGLRQLIDFQIDHGVHGLFICGTYGSGPLMTVEERQRLHQIVVDQVDGRVPVVAHVGSTATAHAVALARHAELVGVDFLAAIPPFYYRHDARTVEQFFATLCEATDRPLYVYNNPDASGFAISPEFLRRLAERGVEGIMDSSFSYLQFSHFRLHLEEQAAFDFFAGNEGMALPALMLGARGCVSNLANAFPEMLVQLWDLFNAGQYEEAAGLQLQITRARQILHATGSTVAACYTVLNRRGVQAGGPKAPILPLEEAAETTMLSAFEEIGVL